MGKQSITNSLWKLSAMGFTFVSMIIAGGIIGWLLNWILGKFDVSWLSHERTFIIVGVIVGIIIGMVDFIRTAKRAIREIDS